MFQMLLLMLTFPWPCPLGRCYAVHINASMKGNNMQVELIHERNNMQVELIRFSKKYRLYSSLLLRREELADRRNVYVARSLDLCDRQIVLRDWWICVIDYNLLLFTPFLTV